MKSYPKGGRFHVNLFLKSRGGVSIFFFLGNNDKISTRQCFLNFSKC